jgi:hypothetical protein
MIKKRLITFIKTVIPHWPALKDTSPEAFRETFINREAYLIDREENGWLLKVDRKGVDMLLNTLPWGIGMVKLTWSERTFILTDSFLSETSHYLLS